MKKSKLDRISYNIRINTLAGVMSVVAANLAMPFLKKFAERLGAQPFHMGLLSSLPAAISILVLIPGAIAVEKFERKKIIVGVLMAMHRFFFLCFALIPFVKKSLQVPMVVFLVVIMNLPGALFNSNWQAFMADIFPEEKRGYAFAKRSKYSTFFGISTTFISGQLLARVPKLFNGNGVDYNIRLYQVFFLCAFLISIIEVLLHFKMRESKIKKTASLQQTDHSKFNFIRFTTDLMANKRFVLFTIASLMFHFGWQMGWPLFDIYQIYNLKFEEAALSIIGVTGGISSVLTYTSWSNYARNKGNGYALYITAAMMAVTPFLYAISRNIMSITLVNAVIGVSVAGFTLILFNTTLEVVPKESRVMYIAFYNTLINISAVIAPIIGVWINDRFNIFYALIVTGIFRFIGAAAFFVRHKMDKKLTPKEQLL